MRPDCRETGGIITNYREKIRGHVCRIVLAAALLLCSACKKQDEFTWAFVPPEGCEGVVVSGEGESEIVRYEWNGEWVVLSRQGFFDASARGSALITVSAGGKTFSLEQFYEPLYRPDIIEAMLNPPLEQVTDNTSNAASAIPAGLADIGVILKEGNAPSVEFSFSVEASASAETGAGGEGDLLRIRALDNGSGVGKLLLFSVAVPAPGENGNAAAFPLALYGAAALPSRQTENGRTVYELVIPRAQWETITAAGAAAAGGALAVSAFDARFGIESPRLVIAGVSFPSGTPLPAGISPPQGASPSTRAELMPVLHIFAPAAELPEELAAFFTRQEQGRLYSAVAIHSPGDFDLSAVGAEDTFIVFAGSPALPDNTGDFAFQFGESVVEKWQLLARLLETRSERALIFLDPSGVDTAEQKTGLARLSRWTGNRLLLTTPGAGTFPRINDITAALSGTAEFIAAASQKGYTHVSGSADFPLFDVPAYRESPGYGEILMQTLASGSVIIEDFDRASSALWFGETKSRSVPAGEYLVSMIYRNGIRETKRAQVAAGRSVWVVFNYVPNLVTWDFKDGLPSFGVYIGELDPANYQTIDAEVLTAMGMEAHTAALLAGNKLYQAGDYDKAITEYNTAVRQKPDFADAYAWRGNAWRRKGDTARAIADYTLALKYKSNYPEVYNYRGFLYAQTGDYRRAIADYTEALRRRPDFGDALFNRAYTYAKTGDFTKAIDDYTQVLRLEPANAAAYTERGRAWLNLGDTEKAEADFVAASAKQ